MVSSTMKWLQWNPNRGFEKGLGGVEVHARSIHHNLTLLGIESHISSDPDDLLGKPWDVIHTHGSGSIPLSTRQKLFQKDTILAHTLHGTSLGRVAACREWYGPRGYMASWKELESVMGSHVVFSIHHDLWLHKLAEKIKGKEAAIICDNGWDPGLDEKGTLPKDLENDLNPLETFWVYIGRGNDAMKNTSVLIEAFRRSPRIGSLLTIPGDGFENDGKRFIASGRLNSAQIHTLLSWGPKRIKGLLLSSVYEGLPLVVLEALARGIPVITSNVGGIKHLSPQLKGLFRLQNNTPTAFLEKMQEVSHLQPQFAKNHTENIENNRRHLSTWKQVTERCIEAVENYRANPRH